MAPAVAEILEEWRRAERILTVLPATAPERPMVEADVHALFAPHWDVERLTRRDILASEPRFIAEGVTALATAAYRLQRR